MLTIGSLLPASDAPMRARFDRWILRWAKSSICTKPASGLQSSAMLNARPPIALNTGARRRSGHWRRDVPRGPVGCSTRTRSTRKTRREIAGGEALDRHRGAQDQRQPRERLLERAEGYSRI